MGKNILIGLLSLLLLASWLLPRSSNKAAEKANPPSTPSENLVIEALPSDPLADGIEAMQASPGFEASGLGWCVLGDDGEEPFFAYRAEVALTPASTLKAVTSATALEMLGPDFRFETQLGATQDIELDPSGTFAGDLILLGGGDPFLTSITLTQWARHLRQMGLKKLDGRVIADARCFPERLIPDAWDWGDVSNYYGAGPSGLNLDFNRFTITFEPAGEPDEPARIASMTPPLAWLNHHHFATTGAAGSPEWTSIYGGPYTETLTFRGRIPLDSGPVESRGAIPDPAYHAADRFAALLRLEGIEVTGEVTTARRLFTDEGVDLPAPHTVVLTHDSEPLTEIIRYLHRTSDNMVTECLFQKLQERDSLGRSGVEIVTQHWEERGLRVTGLRMEDGSGLARADFIRPLDLAKILWLARRGPHGEAYFQSLNASREGRVRWKGGAMSRVRAYTGYTGNGYTFALMINRYDADAETLAHWRAKLVDLLLALPPAGDEPPSS